MPRVLIAGAILVVGTGSLWAGSGTNIHLERTACFGTCPVYTLDLDGDGRVRLNGEQYVAELGLSTKTVSARNVADILSFADKVGFFSFKTRYSDSVDGCTELWTDHPTAVVEISSNGKTHRVTDYHGCKGPAAVEALRTLEDLIDEKAEVGAWKTETDIQRSERYAVRTVFGAGLAPQALDPLARSLSPELVVHFVLSGMGRWKALTVWNDGAVQISDSELLYVGQQGIQGTVSSEQVDHLRSLFSGLRDSFVRRPANAPAETLGRLSPYTTYEMVYSANGHLHLTALGMGDGKDPARVELVKWLGEFLEDPAFVRNGKRFKLWVAPVTSGPSVRATIDATPRGGPIPARPLSRDQWKAMEGRLRVATLSDVRFLNGADFGFNGPGQLFVLVDRDTIDRRCHTR